jgi:hypothetical protein
MKEKKFITLTPGVKVIKLFVVVANGLPEEAGRLFPGLFFQVSLEFVT